MARCLKATEEGEGKRTQTARCLKATEEGEGKRTWGRQALQHWGAAGRGRHTAGCQSGAANHPLCFSCFQPQRRYRQQRQWPPSHRLPSASLPCRSVSSPSVPLAFSPFFTVPAYFPHQILWSYIYDISTSWDKQPDSKTWITQHYLSPSEI